MLFITVRELDFDHAVATNTAWCADCHQFSAPGCFPLEEGVLCSHCGGTNTFGASLAQQKHLFIFSSDSTDR